MRKSENTNNKMCVFITIKYNIVKSWNSATTLFEKDNLKYEENKVT